MAEGAAGWGGGGGGGRGCACVWLRRVLGDGVSVQWGQAGSAPHNGGEGGSFGCKLCQERRRSCGAWRCRPGLCALVKGHIQSLGGVWVVGGGEGRTAYFKRRTKTTISSWARSTCGGGTGTTSRHLQWPQTYTELTREEKCNLLSSATCSNRSSGRHHSFLLFQLHWYCTLLFIQTLVWTQ